MGQGESKPTVKAEPVQQPVEKTPSSSNIQIPRIKQKPLVSDSLVAGSPLSTVEHYSTQQDVDQQMRRIQIAEPRFVQPPGEPSYKNSSKIVHSFGPGGIGFAPLQPLNKQPSKNTPVIITWAHGGNAVFLTGSFNNWKQKIRLQKSTQDFTTVVDMPPGKHNLKFIVDDEWKCSEDLPTASDADGNLVNYIEVAEDAMDDGLDFLGKEEDLELPESPKSSYNNELPAYLQQGRKKSASPDDVPPLLPAQLNKVLLNSKSILSQDAHYLPVPNHASLNHLYAQSIRDGVMAIGATTRYRKKVLDLTRVYHHCSL